MKSSFTSYLEVGSLLSLMQEYYPESKDKSLVLIIDWNQRPSFSQINNLITVHCSYVCT